MDAFGGLLSGPRAHGAFALRTIMDPPWSVRVEDRAPLSLAAIVRGDAWVLPDDGAPTRLAPGDLALMRGPDPYTFADSPTTPPQVVIHPGQRCSTPDGADLEQALDLGTRSWGNDPNGTAVMLIGTYETQSEVGRRVLNALPALAVLDHATWESPLIPVLAQEIVKDEPGQEVVLDRLIDLLLVAALRSWFSRGGAETPAWYRAHADPVVGKAIAIIHHNPARPWTVATLAAEVGVSRAALARRFTELVGEPPMSYPHRLALGAGGPTCCASPT